MRKVIFIFAVVFLLAILAPTSVWAVVSPNVNISKLTGYQAEVTIAIDPTNPNRMFASSNIGSGNGMFAAYSTDGGTTWAYTDPVDKVIGDGDADNVPLACCDPIAAFDKFGNLYLAYLSSGIAVRVVVSTNGGQSFSGTNFAGEEFGNFPVPGDKNKPFAELESKVGEYKEEGQDVINQSGDQPTIAVGPSFFAGEASVYVSWNGGGVIRVAGTRASGLGAITPFDNSFITTLVVGNYGDIEVGPNGQVLVTAQAASGGQGPTTINVSLDPDGLGPANFNLPVNVATNRKNTSLFSLENFGASILVTSTNVGGFDFIPAQANRSVDAEADLSWDKTGGVHNGRVYLAYTEETVNENNDMNIMLRYSNDNGATWTVPLKVNDDTTTRSQFFPKIEVDQTTGYIAVAFYDCRNDGGGTDAVVNTEAEVFGAVSYNGGTSFVANELISQGSSRSASFANGNDYGDYNGLAFHNNKYFYIWADNSNSTSDNPNGIRTSPDVYTAKVTVLAPSASSVSVGGRVFSTSGRGLANASVIMTKPDGETVRTRTNPFGYYRFSEVQSGETYIFNVQSKRFQFAQQVVNISDDLDGLNFFAQ
jgi:Carboxypeptidase regulatory-like domain